MNFYPFHCMAVEHVNNVKQGELVPWDPILPSGMLPILDHPLVGRELVSHA